MRRLCIGVALAALAPPAWGDSGLTRVQQTRHAVYDMQSGLVRPSGGPHTRGPTVCWDSTRTSGYFSQRQPNELVLDWGDADWTCLGQVGSFQIGYATDLPGGVEIDVVFYSSDNGFDTFTRTPEYGFRLTGLPGSTSPGLYLGWYVTVNPATPINLGASADLDGDALGDFSYSYHFRNADAGGTALVGPLIAGDPNVAPGIENVFDLFSIDPNVIVGPNDFLLPDINTVYDGPFWYGGTPFAQFYMRLSSGDANEPPPCCVGDIEPPGGDCDVDLVDLAVLLGDFGGVGPHAGVGDIEPCLGPTDQDVDGADLALMLSNFGFIECLSGGVCLDCATAGSGSEIFLELLTPTTDPNLPPDTIVADVSVVPDAADGWTASGLVGQALGGATLIYANDPNTGERLLTNVAVAGATRVTFASRPRPQFSGQRFGPDGAVSFAGGARPGEPTPVATPQDVSLFAFVFPPPPGGGEPAGYVQRIALDIGGLGLDAEGAYLSLAGPLDPRDTLVFSGESTSSAYQNYCFETVTWEVYVSYVPDIDKKCNCPEVTG
jgi:hypothetical protein